MRVDGLLRGGYHPGNRRTARRPGHGGRSRYRATPTRTIGNARSRGSTRLATAQHQEQRAEHDPGNAKHGGQATHLIACFRRVATHGRHRVGVWAGHHDVHRDRRRNFERGVRLTRAAVLSIGDRSVANRPHRALGSGERERELAAGLASRNTCLDIGCGARHIWGRSVSLLIHEEGAGVGESKSRSAADLSPRKRRDRVLEATFANDHQSNGSNHARTQQQPTHRRCGTSAP